MNTVDLLPLQESMAQRGAGKHDQWRQYMTVLVVNHRIVQPICMLTADIRRIMKFHVDKPQNCFCQEVEWTLAIC
jgi:hypothetical protein